MARVDTATAVEVRDFGRAFGGRTVLHGVDLTLRAGEFVALLGRSGSGKSTLLRALAGLDTEYTGSLLTPDRVAVAFQEPRLLPWRRVTDNVALGLRGADQRGRAAAALAEVGLSDRAEAWPLTLSGGEAQRASLARALVREPELLLLDEPFGALDALTRLVMHDLVLDVWSRHRPAVLLVTHDVDEAVALADRVLVLDDGRLSIDLAIDIERPRDRSGADFGRHRRTLLNALGVHR
jgi:sulfonate transport system ATP-binding protein